MTSRLDEALLRSLTPGVLGILVRRGADFAAAEDAVQDALVEAVRVRPTAGRPRDPKGWLITVAWRRFLDATRSDTARRRREDLLDEEPAPGPAPALDDTLRAELDPALPRHTAVAAYLHERDGGPALRRGGPTLRRGGPQGPHPRRTRPPDPPGGPPQPRPRRPATPLTA